MSSIIKPDESTQESCTRVSSSDIVAAIHKALLSVDQRYKAILPRLRSDTQLQEIGLESTQMLEMAAHLEDELGIFIEDSHLAEVNTLRELIELLEREEAKT